MNTIENKTITRSEFALKMASIVVREMTDAQVSFDELAKKLNCTKIELLDMVYSKKEDITVYQLATIVEALGCDIFFRSNPISKKPATGHLRAVENSDPYDNAG